jgi:hypothetical protein
VKIVLQIILLLCVSCQQKSAGSFGSNQSSIKITFYDQCSGLFLDSVKLYAPPFNGYEVIDFYNEFKNDSYLLQPNVDGCYNLDTIRSKHLIYYTSQDVKISQLGVKSIPMKTTDFQHDTVIQVHPFYQLTYNLDSLCNRLKIVQDSTFQMEISTELGRYIINESGSQFLIEPPPYTIVFKKGKTIILTKIIGEIPCNDEYYLMF